MRYVLRAPTFADVPRLLELHEQAFRPLVETRSAWCPEEQTQIVRDSFLLGSVVEVQGVAVGQLMVERHPEHVFLKRLMLDPEVQGRGLGRQIVWDVIDRAAPLPVTLSVWETNRARSLYERLGFRVTHVEGHKVKMRRDPEAPPTT